MKGKFSQSFVAGLLIAGVLALAGCTSETATTSGGAGNFGPGGGGGTGGNPGGGTVGSSGSKVQLLVSTPQLPSAGTTTIDLTAVVLDVNSQAIPGTVVTLSTGTDPSAFISQISNAGAADTNGQVTAKLNLGANKSNRTITVTATTPDGATGSNNVGVTGTTITISGNSSLALNASTTLTFALKDSGGTAIPGITLTLASATGNSLAPASGITDASGQITSVVTATQVTSPDTITANGAGATKTQQLTVSSATFGFTAPAPSVDIPLGSSTPLSVHWTQNGNPVVGQQVTFTTSRGTISGSPSTTNVTGDTPAVSVSSTTSAGPAIITAQGPGNTPAATLAVNFVATSATAVSVQAVPSVVQFTATPPSASQTNNISAITVTVRDANNNLVKNASISLNLTDNTGGQLAANTAITDVSGTASVNYTAGTTNSGQNGVTITATVDKVNGVAITPISSSTTLTVAGQALFVRLGTDNLVQPQPAPNPDLLKTYSAIVTDAAGNAVANAQVRFTLTPTLPISGNAYLKGFYVFNTTANTWQQNVTASCPNEDANNNGILDPGEDANSNNKLDPGNVASVNPSATTNANGVALVTLEYARSYATWTQVTLQASAGVAGNDPPTTQTFFLPGLASDYTNAQVAPPGAISPYGQAASCANPN
jgi:hypothetical protein